MDNYCFVLNGKNGEWVVDSGATCHICSSKAEFTKIDTTWQEKVTVVYSSGKGTCKISMLNEEGTEVMITVDEVLFIPSFKGNLLSVKKFSAKGFIVVFSGRTCKILDAEKSVKVSS